MEAAADRLLKVLNSIDKPPQFCVSGSVAPVLPGLEVAGVGPVGVPVSPAVARQLIGQASQAPYGRGEETIADCPHEIRPVTQGYRVCLVYNLALAQGGRQPEAPRHGEKVEQVAGLLARLFADGARQKVAIPP